MDESHRIEAKQSRQIDRSIMETICEFANETGKGQVTTGRIAAQSSGSGQRYCAKHGVELGAMGQHGVFLGRLKCEKWTDWSRRRHRRSSARS